MRRTPEDAFWRSVWAIRGAITLRVLPRVLIFGGLSWLCLAAHPHWPELGLEVGPVEIAGGALGLLLVLRTNAGYDRWWEGRKTWGAMVNDLRGLATAGVAYARADDAWCKEWVHTCAAFAHVARSSLRGSRTLPDVGRLLGAAGAAAMAEAHHMPTWASYQQAVLIGRLSRAGEDRTFILLHLEGARLRLLSHVGACERIISSPLPRVYVIAIRRFIFLYLLLLPLALVEKVGWATPLLTMLVAYPVLGMDHIAHELQNPFSPNDLGNLDLDGLCSRLEKNLCSLLAEVPP